MINGSFDTTASLHPDCPDWQRLGPTPADAAIRAMADVNEARTGERETAWSKGFTRRRLIGGGLGAGVAAIGSQLITTRVAYGAGSQTGTLVVMFLRGGMDGLSMLSPVSEDAALTKARGTIAVRSGITMDRGFVLHPALVALKPYVDGGRLAAVPAISTPALTRSHFQAQDCLERGGFVGAGSSSGWLDRLLDVLGTGTTFRAVAGGYTTPRSLGMSSPVVMHSLQSFALSDVPADLAPATETALRKLYTGVDHAMSGQALLALTAADVVEKVNAKEASPVSRGYSNDGFGNALASLGSLIRNDQTVRVATVDLGGWDMHSNIGTQDSGDFFTMAKYLGQGLNTFLKDLGPAADRTTVVVMSEFGRRVAKNASGGTDHGHGGVALVLGGGVKGGVKGAWDGLGALEQGDLPGSNDYRNLLSEVVMKRFGLTEAQIAPVFPNWKPDALGVMA